MVPATVLQATSFAGSVPTSISSPSAPSSPSVFLPFTCRNCFNNLAFRHSRSDVILGDHFSVKQLLRRSCSRESGGRACRGLPVCAHFNASDEQVERQETILFSNVVRSCAVWVLAAATVASIYPANLSADAFEMRPILSELSVLISGPPIKDPNTLLRYALPIDNKPIKEVQKSLEDISENLKLPGEKALDPTERNVRQAARFLSQNKVAIVAGLAESKKEHGEELLDKLTVGLQEFQNIIEERNREAVAPKQKELLYIVGDVEEAMVEKFPFEVPKEFASKPLLKGRARVDMKIRIKDNPNLKDVVFQMVLDGYNAPVTAGNFVDLVERHFYDGMEIQRADGFVVQTGDPDGPTEGFVDPSTEKIRTIPLEIMLDGDKEPIYGLTLEELGRFKSKTKLPFNAFGTLAMAREEFDNNSASSQIFWLLKESELTPSNANILDGRYTVFGYVTDNQDLLADVKVGDVIESVKVVAGLENLTNPSY